MNLSFPKKEPLKTDFDPIIQNSTRARRSFFIFDINDDRSLWEIQRSDLCKLQTIHAM